MLWCSLLSTNLTATLLTAALGVSSQGGNTKASLAGKKAAGEETNSKKFLTLDVLSSCSALRFMLGFQSSTLPALLLAEGKDCPEALVFVSSFLQAESLISAASL